ncbi:hypothetical protein [Desulfopila sp. IMCC35008]|uniref:hypothetical protein n=1 Tax=Desulfopila sp. IMCC35008 TaxID=2653858 RepID=UPI0013D5393A|nr:hypothetical protein [Desulfopila sp. IMCC35008]
MNTLEALYFPGTEIYSASQFPVFLLFGKLHLIKPVEEPEQGDDTADIFTTAGLCQAHTPCPLGDQRERFEHLIRDIRERKDDYAAQLSNLTVSSFSAKKKSVDDSSRSIVSTLLGKTETKEDEDDIRNNELWQSRLILKIGEQLDREEEEVAVRMALLDDDEQGLFKTLQGELDEEEETLFGELLDLKSRLNKPSATSVATRLKAWSRIYRESTASLPTIYLTHLEDAADHLLEEYENKMQLPPVELLHLLLPGNIGWDTETAISSFRDFQEKEPELLEKVATFITGMDPQLQRESLEDEWSKSLESHFPAADTGRLNLHFHTMSTITCAKMLGGKTNGASDILAVVRWPE